MKQAAVSGGVTSHPSHPPLDPPLINYLRVRCVCQIVTQVPGLEHVTQVGLPAKNTG